MTIEKSLGTPEGTPLLGPPRRQWQAPTRSRMNKRTAFLLAAAGLTFLYILGDNTVPNGLPNLSKKKDVCLTPACVHASSEILYNLSPNYKELDPCTDFEELVCGGWRERHDLRPDQGDAFTGTQMSEASQMLLRHILEADYPKNSAHSYFSPASLDEGESNKDAENFGKMQVAYGACMNESRIAELDFSPIKEIIEQFGSLFPHPDAENVTHDDVPAIRDSLKYLNMGGISALVDAGTGADDRDPDTVVISISAPWRIGLPSKERYKDALLVDKYTKMLTEVMSHALPGREVGSHRDVVAFETLLAAASPSTEEREDVTKYYNPMSLEDAQSLIPLVDIKGLISAYAPHDYEAKRVIVAAPTYLKELNQILAETRRSVVYEYFVWKLIQSLAGYVESDVTAPLRRFNNELQGKAADSRPERWRTCVAHVDDGLGWILSRFFVEKAFSAKAKKFGDTIVSDIKTEFAKTLKHTEWMDKKVIELAIEKVHNIVQKIGYPTKSPDIMNPDALAKYYDRVSVAHASFLKNELAMRNLQVENEWSSLGKPVDRDQWDMTVPTVNAYYNPPGNEIVFPAGIMQAPVFDVNTPQYLSYGAFGAVAGHELSHAFDSTGRHYDQNGNYTDWWTNKTVAAFKEKADCFVKQYAEFSIDGPDGKQIHVNGRLTLGENIADAGGLGAAFSAWKKRAAHRPNQDLPGLSDFFTQEQLFFVSYSNWWCGKSRPETAVNRIYTDPHAPKWARILGTMANSRDFRESFKCKAKEPVCKLW